MKKLLILIALFALALAVEAKRKAEPVLLDEEFNPWFQYEEPVQKINLFQYNLEHSAKAKLDSKMDVIDPNSTKYTPVWIIFSRVKPKTIPIPTKRVIKEQLVVPTKIEHLPTDVDLKRANNSN